MAKIIHFLRRLLLPKVRYQRRKYEILASGETATPYPLRTYEVSDESEGSVSEGFVPILVGKERKRFMVAVRDINHPLMATLLQISAESGFEQSGAVRVVCDVVSFRRMLSLMESEPFNQ